MAEAWSNAGNLRRAQSVLDDMEQRGPKPSVRTYKMMAAGMQHAHVHTQVHTGAHVGAERGRSAQDTPLTNDMILVRVREFGHEYEHDDR